MTAQESIDNLVRELGIANLPEEEQAEMLQDVIEQLDAGVSMRVADRLDDKQFEQYEQLMEDDSDAATAELHKLVPDYDELVAVEAAQLKERMKGLMA